MEGSLGHIPVLKDTIVEVFQSVSGCVLDATFGGGGHTRALLSTNPHISIVALDADPEAIARSEAVEKQFPGRFEFHSGNFAEASSLGKRWNAALMDLGVSSFQVDQAERGFSFRNEGPLDMRMNPEIGLSAREFLQTAHEEELVRAIRDFGEEPQWRNVVRAILTHRDREDWVTTTDFVNFLMKKTTLYRSKKPGIHPATRTFQGLRIYVNDELGCLEEGLRQIFDDLQANGLLAVITFHSLEDRIVKQFFREKCGKSLNRDDAEPRQFKTIEAREYFRKPVVADDVEIQQNPRARSAKLRIIQKLP